MARCDRPPTDPPPSEADSHHGCSKCPGRSRA